MNNHDNMKQLMETVDPYQPLNEAPRHIGGNERYSSNNTIDINIPPRNPKHNANAPDAYAEFKEWLESSPVQWDIDETMSGEVVIRFRV
jgi:hypothetical protein